MIKSISLTNFRQFKQLGLTFNKNLIILHGDNTKGKSTILEAISLVTNGVSPWASSDEYISFNQKDDNGYCRIEINLNDKPYSFFKDNKKRVLKIDSQNTVPRKFFEKTASTIFNPEQIEILMISPSKRREFLDDTIIAMQYDYSNKLTEFRKILKQRNAYLKKLAKAFYEKGIIARNDTQLNFWTQQFIDVSNHIQKERELLTNEMILGNLKMKYIKSNEKDSLENAVEDSKKKDIVTGYTNVGPHRDDWILSNGNDIKKFGSRGEKRLAIGHMIFKKQEIIANKLGSYPILLLDDIASELDVENTKKIFDKEFLKKQQTFLTVINPNDLPKDILNNAQLIDLNSLE